MPTTRDDILPLVPKLRAFARSLTNGNRQIADDLVQDTVVLALQSWDKFTPDTNLRAWLFRILRNRFINTVRRKHVQAEVMDEDLMRRAWVPPTQETGLEVRDFKSAFRALSPAHREVLILVALHRLPYEQVAEICGCAVGTVKSRVTRARTALKRLMSGEGAAGSPVQAPTPAPRFAVIRAAPLVIRPRQGPAPTPAPVPAVVPAVSGIGVETDPALILPGTVREAREAALDRSAWLAETEARIVQAQAHLETCRALSVRMLNAGMLTPWTRALVEAVERRLSQLQANHRSLAEAAGNTSNGHRIYRSQPDVKPFTLERLSEASLPGAPSSVPPPPAGWLSRRRDTRSG